MVCKFIRLIIAATAFLCILDNTFGQYAERKLHNNVSGIDWSVRLGAMAFYTPKYEGADEYEMKGFPLIDITWRNRAFLNPHKGFGAFLWSRGGSKLGLSLGYAFGRDEDDSNDLNGLGDLDPGASANVLVEHPIGKFSLDGRYVHQISGHSTGFQVNLAYVTACESANKSCCFHR